MQLYAGVDIHKEFCQIHVIDQDGLEVRKGRVQSTVKDILAFFDYLPDKVRIVVEACGIKDNILDALRVRGFDVVLSNPLRNRLIAEAVVKTDKLDAKILAELLRVKMISTVYYPSKNIRELRDAVRQRQYYVQQNTANKNRVQRILLRNGTNVSRGPFSTVGMKLLQRDDYPAAALVHQLLATITSLNTTIITLEEDIQKKSLEFPEIAKLDRIFGVGNINAATIWSEIGDLNRFTNQKKLVGLAGLHPTLYQSGNTERRWHTSCSKTTRHSSHHSHNHVMARQGQRRTRQKRVLYARLNDWDAATLAVL